mgnify:CR=1 FL=1|tara:strand:- start:924 stop:1391 length:468 start_codon:yes stop_codon:yes gene_type:complete
MYTCIEDNKEIMTLLRRNKESLEANCYVLKAVRNEPYEKQLEIAKGLLLNDKETKRRRNKEEYEANKVFRREEQMKRDNEMIQCPYCDVAIKAGSLFRHKNNRICIEKQEELYGPLDTTLCELCNLRVREVELDKHMDSKKCYDRQELIRQLNED